MNGIVLVFYYCIGKKKQHILASLRKAEQNIFVPSGLARGFLKSFLNLVISTDGFGKSKKRTGLDGRGALVGVGTGHDEGTLARLRQATVQILAFVNSLKTLFIVFRDPLAGFILRDFVFFKSRNVALIENCVVKLDLRRDNFSAVIKAILYFFLPLLVFSLALFKRASEILCPWDNRSPPIGCIQ